MRLAMLIIVLAMAGCATDGDGLAGKNTKNGGPERVERLGVLTTSASPAGQQCRARQIRWCSGRGRGMNCKCVYIRVAEERFRRMARDRRNQSINP